MKRNDHLGMAIKSGLNVLKFACFAVLCLGKWLFDLPSRGLNALGGKK